MERLVAAAVERGARVIHIKAGDVFRARIDGKMVKLSSQVLAAEDVRQLALRLISNERDRENLDSLRDYDTSWDLADVGRFRVNILRQRGKFMIIMRVIPLAVPTLDELNLPPVLGEIAELPRGIVLITGAVGTGKSNTLAAMVGWLNSRLQKHIVTLEDPIEFLHPDDVSTVTQREIGVDTPSFRDGLRAALRQDADVILIGEMRDRETVATAIRAAELGLLVITTMHSATAVGAIGQLLGSFEDDELDLVRSRVADTLMAVIAQRLLPRSGTDTLIPAVEVLRVTGAVRECILNARPAEEIMELMEQGREAYGMRTMQQSLRELVQIGLVDYELAKSAAPSPSDFELVMETLADDGPHGGQ
ncbi:MAG: PilT/PilU family type 4a pilus ATPase [Gemmatimonadota bacterium]|nr:PilT/PilU family type 4a pilus ATPase [Gemmatimonadota bacterium]MDH3426908.1 PilT/PilU family type 4a pilus ATPase [Gemmatimonadota bacterium]